MVAEEETEHQMLARDQDANLERKRSAVQATTRKDLVTLFELELLERRDVRLRRTCLVVP